MINTLIYSCFYLSSNQCLLIVDRFRVCTSCSAPPSFLSWQTNSFFSSLCLSLPCIHFLPLLFLPLKSEIVVHIKYLHRQFTQRRPFLWNVVCTYHTLSQRAKSSWCPIGRSDSPPVGSCRLNEFNRSWKSNSARFFSFFGRWTGALTVVTVGKLVICVGLGPNSHIFLRVDHKSI